MLASRAASARRTWLAKQRVATRPTQASGSGRWPHAAGADREEETEPLSDIHLGTVPALGVHHLWKGVVVGGGDASGGAHAPEVDQLAGLVVQHLSWWSRHAATSSPDPRDGCGLDDVLEGELPHSLEGTGEAR